MSSANPVSVISSLEFELPDFAVITPESLRTALQAGIASEEAAWESIASQESLADVENTVVAVERAGEALRRASALLHTYAESIGGDEWGELETEFTPKLTEHADKFWLDERIYQRYSAIESAAPLLGLDAETTWLVKETLRQFRDSGIWLSPENREVLKDLNARIAAVETEFSHRETKALEAAALTLAKADLEGLDPETRNALAASARERGKDGFLLTYLGPTQQPLLTRLTKPEVRRRVLESSLSRGVGHDPETDTRPQLLELARLRALRAELLGNPNHASVVAAEGTAKSADAVAARLAQLAGPAARNAIREAEELIALKSKNDKAPFLPSDWAYYEEQLRARKFAVDDEILRPYLELNSVMEKGVFFAANRLFGITFHRRPDLAGHHPDVIVWEVREESGEPLGLFLGDFYARKGKRSGAWMHNLVSQSALLGTKPVVVNTLNITKPAAGEATLLTWDETRTLFHEFGHALHGLLSNAYYPSLEGTSVPRDFVEYPSQVNEMWMVNREVLANFARHYKSGEMIPAETLANLEAMGSFGQGFATSEYLQAALLDQAWHRLTPSEVPTDPAEVAEFERRALHAAGVYNDLVPPRYRSSYFMHAFAGEYDANYYSYIWSEVLDADTVDGQVPSCGVTFFGLVRR